MTPDSSSPSISDLYAQITQLADRGNEIVHGLRDTEINAPDSLEDLLAELKSITFRIPDLQEEIRGLEQENNPW